MTSQDKALFGMWEQQSLVPVEKFYIEMSVHADKVSKSCSLGVKIYDGWTDDLLGMYAGPKLDLQHLEARATGAMRELLKGLELDKDSQEPF